MEEFGEDIVVETVQDDKLHHDQPEEVVIILPDESCFEYEGSRKPRLDGNKISWTKQQTHSLITEYKENREELENPTTTKAVIWEKIAEKFNEKWNTNFSADMCANKWRSMKNTYKKVRYSQRPEASKKRWEYYDALNEVYKGMKIAQPNSRLLDNLSVGQQAVHIVQFAPHHSNHQVVEQAYSPPRVVTSEHLSSYESEAPSWFKEFIREYQKSEETKLKVMQQTLKDIVRLGERQCKALEKLASELNK